MKPVDQLTACFDRYTLVYSCTTSRVAQCRSHQEQA